MSELKNNQTKRVEELKESNNNMVNIAENRLKQIRDLENRVRELEKELKSTITKKNRHLKTKDKIIKKLEWKAMIHERGHADVYAKLYELQESLKGESE